MRFILIAIFVASMSFAHAAEVSFTVTDLETAVKNAVTSFSTKVAEYNKLSKNAKSNTEYPVPMALDDNGEYILVSVIKKEYNDSRKGRIVEDNAKSDCINNLLTQFIENKNKSQRIVIVASVKNLQLPYTNEKHKIDGGKLWQKEDGSYLYVCTCATTFKDIVAGDKGLIAKVSDL